MINIALSNSNSQGIQEILENDYAELKEFVETNNDHNIVRLLLAYILSEHVNVNSEG